MRFHSTRSNETSVGISEAMQIGLAPDDGLFVPEYFPQIQWKTLDKKMTYPQFAVNVLAPYFKGDELLPQLNDISDEAFNFDLPLRCLDKNNYILELFHGPTLSFKDFGARFLASCLSRIKSHKLFTILVATSGDTGSAVAAAFHNKPNIRVIVLYPKGKISLRQQKQITCWGDNILAIAVNGRFDDCQRLVKAAFNDEYWQKRTVLNTANSINIGRLLPQSTYYAYTSWQYHHATGNFANFIVPSGNVGNISAAFWAKKMGFPIEHIILAQNANNIVGEYVTTGKYTPKESIETLANAMDVGKPSNFERLQYLYPNYEAFIDEIFVVKANDDEISQTIKKVYRHYHEIICPHTATAFYAREHLDKDKPYIMIATAHPAKFEQIIEPILKQNVAPTKQLKALIQREHYNVTIDATMQDLIAADRCYFR
ncbi:threonine synthase [Thiotrichales bacterium 19S3-7]|nr:threonine synthase [Thiotrichales bacterium 19S3-7]MCF6802521.1 threonine synthase [Thiotrichales bacterium 19S3-11]